MKTGRPPFLSAFAFFCAVSACSGLTAPAQPTLLELAKEHFTPRQLTEAEEKLFIATEKGELASMLPANGEENDPALASTWPASRSLHADALAWLCTDPAATAKINYRGVRLSGMRIEGELNLSEARLNLLFSATKCAFDGEIVLNGARLRWFVLNGSSINSLTARRTQFDADVSLSEGFVAKGPVDLSTATISGDLSCGNAQIETLVAKQAKIEGRVNLWQTVAKGPIDLSSAIIRGDLACESAHIETLDAKDARIEGRVTLGQTVAKSVNLSSATIRGDLSCENAQLEFLVAEQAKIEGTVLLRYSQFKSVNFLAATIGESLECDGTHLANPGKTALLVERATIKGSVFLRSGKRNSDPSAPPEWVPFQAEGQVNLLAATIHGSLVCHGACLSDPPLPEPPEKRPLPLLWVDRAKITGHVFLQSGFCCDGIADFRACEAPFLYWAGVEVTENTAVNLESAKIGAVSSDNLAWVRAPGQLVLDGFVYSRILGRSETEPEELFKWLALQSPEQFHPQPYEQLAAVLKSTGREKEAREIMVEKNRRHQKFTTTLRGEWWWYNVFGKLIGYGYLPSRAFFMSLGMIAIGAILFRIGYAADIISPTSESAYASYGGTRDPAGSRRYRFCSDYPKFNAFIFSLESFTPLLRLDQSSNWAPNAQCGKRLRFWKLNFSTTGQWLRVYLWLHVILGWILTSLWVGSITGLVKT
jgi:hypothetical protein